MEAQITLWNHTDYATPIPSSRHRTRALACSNRQLALRHRDVRTASHHVAFRRRRTWSTVSAIVNNCPTGQPAVCHHQIPPRCYPTCGPPFYQPADGMKFPKCGNTKARRICSPYSRSLYIAVVSHNRVEQFHTIFCSHPNLQRMTPTPKSEKKTTAKSYFPRNKPFRL